MSLKLTAVLTFFASVLVTLSSAKASVTLWSNDFEIGSSAVWVPIPTQSSVSVVDDPTGAVNKVLQLWDQGAAAAATEWGEIRPGTITYYALQPFEVRAGVDTATFSVRLYIPSTGVATNTDRINLILRYSNVQTPSTGQFTTNSLVVQFSTLARDQWHNIVFESASILAFGAVEEGGMPTSLYITPVLSVADYSAYNSQGVFVYLDDILLTATPEPTKAMLIFAGMLAILLRRRR